MAEAAELKELEELEEALTHSTTRPVLLFKHSLTCPISGRAYREFQSFLDSADSAASYRLVIVQTARPVSNEVATRLGVIHQSPQAILVKDRRVVWDASHFDITAASLAEAVKGAGN